MNESKIILDNLTAVVGGVKYGRCPVTIYG
jgi:hypothetical protein